MNSRDQYVNNQLDRLSKGNEKLQREVDECKALVREMKEIVSKYIIPDRT